MPVNGKQGPGNLLIVFACSVLCSVATVAVYHMFFSQRTVVMDIAGFIASQRDGYVSGKISAGDLVHAIDGLVDRIGAVKRNEAIVLDRHMIMMKDRPSFSDPAGSDNDDDER